ncbi:glutamate receptor ionotropic, delta-1-like [Centruroides vittatus]|uniref:glutamate receptor ionotropic, delta-1-like n=1 Tax=Centruroides vittatus TaxID=120091 RepID=UPI0035107C22
MWAQYFPVVLRESPEDLQEYPVDCASEDSSYSSRDLYKCSVPSRSCPPYIIFNSKGEVIGGIEYEIVKVFCERLNFKYVLKKPIENDYGYSDKTSGKGLLGRIQTKDVHLGLPSFFMTYEESFIFEFGTAHRFAEVIFITRAPKRKLLLNVLFRPYTKEMWASIFVSVIVTGVIMYLLKRKFSFCHENEKEWSLNGIYWFLFGSLLLKGGDFNNIKRYSLRFIIIFWLLAVIVICNGYSGTMFSFLSIPEYEFVPTTFKELMFEVKNGRYKIGTLKSSGVEEGFMKTKDRVAEYLYAEMKKNESNLVISYEEGITRIFERENFAFIEEKLVILQTANALKKPNVIISRDALFSFTSAFGFAKGVSFLPEINKILRKLCEAGITQKFLRDELAKSRSFSNVQETENTRSLTPYDLLGPFILLISGYIISTLSLICEIIVQKLQQRVA